RINVMIGEDIVGSIRTISTSGNFGPIYIPADDTNTNVREGGVPGDTMQMVLELTDSLKVKLLPKIAWLPGQIQQVTLSDMPTRVTFADISFYVNERKVGEDFIDGDPIDPTALITIQTVLSAEEMSHLDVFLDGSPIEKAGIAIANSGNHPTIQIPLNHVSLADGDHTLSVRIVDTPSSALGAFQFKTFSKLALKNLLNYPNPCRNETCISFNLENDHSANVIIKIFTLSGRLIDRIDKTDVEVGFNQIEWQVRDQDSDRPANGVYLYKVTAEEGDDKFETLGRLIIMN
ncbi:MAG: T9SS C-terminal target domain-containing protein, partial [Calditrichaeota bacterium]